MFERYDHYQSLDPLQALHLLTAFAERSPESTRMLRDAQLKPSVTPFGTRVDLRIRRRWGQWHAQAREAFHKLFKADPGNARYREKVRLGDANYMSVMGAVPNLLRADKPPQDAAEHGYLQEEKLLLTRDPGIDRGRAIYENLRLHATQVRMGMAQGQKSALYMYHVLDDTKRQSSFQGALAGEMFADCTLLHAYSADILRGDAPYRVFLPGDFQPTHEAIALFVRLLLAAPTLFSVKEETLPNVLIAAVTPEEVIYTGGTRFYGAWEMGRVLPFHRYQVTRAEDARRQMQTLQQQIDATAPDAGYRIQMRASMTNIDEDQQAIRQEYEQVKRQMAVLQDRLVELEALRIPRPRLLRFTQAQLPALVSVLRRHRPQDLGHLRYSFQVTEAQPAGAHYLYIEPQAIAHGLDPTIWHDLERAEPIALWLDPTWAAHYHRPPNRIALFVPRGQRLYPAMHSWNSHQMDNYLRNMMQDVPLPKNPIYVVMPDDTPDNLLLSVLDYDGFSPLTDPAVVGWINDNLTVLRNLPDTASDLQKLAKVHRRREHYEEAIRDAKSKQGQFNEVSNAVEQDFTAFVDGLLQALEAEFERVNSDAKAFISQARKLDQHLGKLVTAHDTVQSSISQAENLLDESRSAIKGLGREVRDVERQVDQALRNANNTRDRLDKQVREKVNDLQQRRQELENKIEELERLL